MDNYDSDEEKSQMEKLQNAFVQPGMFVSGWDDPNDLVEEDKDPEASLERFILWSVNENNKQKVEEILQLDASCVHAVDEDGYTPLHRACYNNYTDIAKILLQYKANPNHKTAMGWTPLHSACKWNNTESVALLLQHGADVNARSDGLQTPLHVAATVSDCRKTLSTLLMDTNIDPNCLNNSEETAETIAKRTGLMAPIFEMGHSAYQCEPGLIDDF